MAIMFILFFCIRAQNHFFAKGVLNENVIFWASLASLSHFQWIGQIFKAIVIQFLDFFTIVQVIFGYMVSQQAQNLKYYNLESNIFYLKSNTLILFSLRFSLAKLRSFSNESINRAFFSSTLQVKSGLRNALGMENPKTFPFMVSLWDH